MGKRKGSGGGFGGREDQYGEFGSQDRDEQFTQGKGGRGSVGGGSAGGGPASSNIKFQRYVPKFLQPHVGLLQRDTPAEQDEPAIVKDHGEESDEDNFDDGGALQRALAEDAELAKDEGVQKLLKKQKAQELKEKGNKSYADRNYKEAISYFTQCIELDPDSELFYSNRSAAYAALKQYETALDDAERAIALKPKWAKGFARKGAAHFGLEEFPEAVAAYECATELEPNNEGFTKAKLKAEQAERQQAKAGKIKFKRRRAADSRDSKAMRSQGVKDKSLLSFGGSDEDDS
mmetsp:Transcript_34778/g.82483  ORF Transcript_34778/g.82483 Transcript_34778/m.82483 type:complete len:290 (+) Transcript_34778:171-1040(+)